ncbi:hypothetical protein HELRODRAFT_176027 [Helobdella robusta]|uniref:Uncharacterized protein n=1 Tax=Helobdella robusta TaxID=6412 RepID=T1FA17_HELRO|nr:hypothetical protein HELRODRAFT_176027 [Helobdella robusta]ESO00193.1 hypothetical protein HELRODRAFT_176027 [Helobdella robusta]
MHETSTRHYQHLYDELILLKHALFNSKKDYLDPYFVSPSQLREFLTNVSSNWMILSSNMQILDLHIDRYYRFPNTSTITRVGADIYLFIHIPLTDYVDRFTLYKVLSFPIPIPNSMHSSEIINLPKFIAVSKKNDYYMTFDKRPEILNFQFKLDDTLVKITDNSCVNLIFFNKIDQIQLECEIIVHNVKPPPKIISLNDNKLLMINVNEYLETKTHKNTTDVFIVPQRETLTKARPMCRHSEHRREILNKYSIHHDWYAKYYRRGTLSYIRRCSIKQGGKNNRRHTRDYTTYEKRREEEQKTHTSLLERRDETGRTQQNSRNR